MRILLPLIALLAVGVAVLAPRSAAGDGGNSITSPDTKGNVGWHISLALDAAGNPVVSYTDVSFDGDLQDGDLKVMHCNDPNCAGGGESITSPDTAGVVGLFTSLALDTGGNPVVSYSDRGDLKVMHCNDPSCVGGDESITAADTGNMGPFGRSAGGYDTSLALDATGNPVVSHYDSSYTDLRLVHCNDPDCVGGDESISVPDSIGVVGLSTSLALDAAGNPVVSYYDSTNFDLKVLHCDDPNCVGGGDSITSPDTADNAGLYTSLALDPFGNPVVSSYDSWAGHLKVMHCNDPNCAGGDESISLPDPAHANVGGDSSLVLDTLGNPVVSYYDSTNSNLKVMRCNDPACVGGDDSIVAPDTTGVVDTFTSLVLDAAGNPVIGYYDWTNGDVKVLHCGDPKCSGAKPPLTPSFTPGASTTAISTPTPTSTPTPRGTPTPTRTRTPTPTRPALAGDANKDGSVRAIDAALVLQRSAGLVSSISQNADVNDDGSIDSIDAALILQYVAGLIDRL